VIGLPPDAQIGGPWRVVEGVSVPAAKEAIIDREVASKSGVGLGDKVKILGQEFTLVGLSEARSAWSTRWPSSRKRTLHGCAAILGR